MRPTVRWSRERNWTGDLLIEDTEDFKTMPTIWNPREKIQINRGGHSKKETTFFYFHVEQAKYCKNGSRCPPLWPKRRATSSKNFKNKLQRKKDMSEIQIQMSKLDTISEPLLEITWIGITLLEGRNSMFRRTIFRYLWIILVFGDKENQVLIYFQMRPSMIVGTWMETRHCLNHGLVWRVSRFSTKIHEKDVCGFKAEWRRNRSQQDQETVGQKNGQIRREDHSVKPCIQGLKKQNWTLRENSDAFTSFPTMI